MHVFNLSVHDIVDVLLRKGHLDTRVFNQSSMQEGTRLHSLYQKEQGDDYISEYQLSYSFFCSDYRFNVSGKADGVIFSKDGRVTVEEIKTTVDDLQNFATDHGEWHLGQAKFYAYMIAKEKKLDYVSIVMTYIKQNNFRKRLQFDYTFKFEELESFINEIILRYTKYREKIERFKEERDSSASLVSFPFRSFRSGQKEICDFVTDAADSKKSVYIEAPTGIGKTVSVLYPLIKRFQDHKCDRIFYLTSKNSIKKIAMNTIKLFENQGLKCKSIEFTSKENICFNDKKGHCNPDECPFARHYYDKLLDAIFDSMEEYDSFTREVIEDICYKKDMCPFQFQIDLSLYTDILVCDYSYVYDYRDRLCLEESPIKNTNSYLCVDECHNLPERVKDMYSIEIFTSEIKDALSLCGGNEFEQLKIDIKQTINALESIYYDKEDENVISDGIYLLDTIPGALIDDIEDCLTDIKTILKKHTHLVTDELLEFFYMLNSFFILSDYATDEESKRTFLVYITVDNVGVRSFRIANLDPKPLIVQGEDFFKSVIYFSATLSPKRYYIDLLGGDVNDTTSTLILPSPFKKENRLVMIDTNLSLRYRDRNMTLYPVFSRVREAIAQKVGNYFVFCPSFEYLERLYSFFKQDPIENADLVVQTRSMKEGERQGFLDRFSVNNEKTTIGLLVIGGIFSEGIDLVGDRLIGAIIISVGLPQISFERNQMKKYFDKISEDDRNGFNYAYTYPGINRILQAGGRVIRTEEDKGFILYIDSRFKQNPYREIFDEVYPDSEKNIISLSKLRLLVKNFWKGK